MFRNLVSLFFFVLAVVANADPEVCVDWETAAEAFEKAYAQWKTPSQYTFTIKSLGSSNSGPKVKRTVKPGQVSRKGPYRGLQTIDDVWKLIKRKCVQGCPNHGAYFCSIEYKKDEKSGLVYPSWVMIDPSETLENSFVYHIDNLCIAS